MFFDFIVNMKPKNIITIIVLAASTFLFQGCDEIYECIFNINPELHDRPLEIGFVGERYYDEVTAEISNEVNDNDYFYDFEVYGDIPPGLSVDFRRRSVEFFGRPDGLLLGNSKTILGSISRKLHSSIETISGCARSSKRKTLTLSKCNLYCSIACEYIPYSR